MGLYEAETQRAVEQVEIYKRSLDFARHYGNYHEDGVMEEWLNGLLVRAYRLQRANTYWNMLHAANSVELKSAKICWGILDSTTSVDHYNSLVHIMRKS